MKYLPESLGTLGVEGCMDGMRPGGAPAQRRLEAALVELVDGVAGGLGVATQRAGDPVGVLAPRTRQQDLATAEDESIRRTQCRLEGFVLGVAKGAHENWSSHVVEDNPLTTALSEHALGTTVTKGTKNSQDESALAL